MDPFLTRCEGAFDPAYESTNPVGLDVDPLLCDIRNDADLQSFMSELQRSPAGYFSRSPALPWNCYTPSDVPCINQAGAFSQGESHVTLQDFDARELPNNARTRKRKYGSMGDLDNFCQPPSLRSELHAEPESSDDSDVRRNLALPALDVAQIPASPHLQIQTTPMKRSSSAGLTSTLMPFSLIKSFPSRDSVSLEDINKRIQTCAEADAAGTPLSSPTFAVTSTRSSGRPHIRVESVPNSFAEELLYAPPPHRAPLTRGLGPQS